jgi:hypothetical protein
MPYALKQLLPFTHRWERDLAGNEVFKREP